MKIAGVIALAATAAFSVYYFVWPLVGGGGDAPQTATATPTTAPSSTPITSTPPEAGPATTDPRATGPSSGPQPAPPRPAPATTSAQPRSTTETPPRPTPPPAATSSVPPRPGPTPAPPRPTTAGSGDGRQLLEGGDIPGAANAFLRELRSSSNKFTVAVGLYCNEDNVDRVVRNASGSDELYVLPTTVQGRRCFRVVWGTFDTRQAAERGMGSLPNGIRAGDAAAVPVASILR